MIRVRVQLRDLDFSCLDLLQTKKNISALSQTLKSVRQSGGPSSGTERPRELLFGGPLLKKKE